MTTGASDPEQETLSTQLPLSAEYARLIEDADAAEAEDFITEELRRCVDDGEVDSLPGLYSHRAIWRLQLGLLRKAEKDLQAARRCHLSPAAALEVRVLLAQCYRALGRPADAQGELDAARRNISPHSVISALALQNLIGAHAAAAPTAHAPAATNGAAAPPKNGTAASTATNGTAAAADAESTNGATTKSNALNKASKPTGRSMGGGFLSGPRPAKPRATPAATPAVPPQPAPQPAPQPRREPPSAATATTTPPPPIEPLREASLSPPPPRAPARVQIVDLDGDPLDEALDAPLALSTDPANTARILAGMGASSQYAGGHEHLQRIERENTIASAINQINAGNFKAPDAALSALLDAQPDHYQALVARGTCRALAGSQKPSELRKAENDFSRAIAVFPDLADVWKRRSQARAALGDFAGAVSDLQDCLKKCIFESAEARSEVLFDLASLYYKQRHFRNMRRVFERYAALLPSASPPTRELCSMMGLSCTAMGDIAEGVKWYKRALERDPAFRDTWLNLFQAYKEGGLVEDAEKAFAQIVKNDAADKTRTMAAYRFRGHMLQCMGRHAAAADVLSRALAPHNGKLLQEQRIECLYLRGACNHAMGRLAAAYTDYDAAFGEAVGNTTAQETLNFRATAYYQGEICVYLHKKLDADVLHFSIDRDLDPEFKECWAKQTMPGQRLLNRCPRALKRGQKFPPDKKDFKLPEEEALGRLVGVCDAVGRLLQYTHQGFMSNMRQQRAAGFAAVELAQRMLQEVAQRRNGAHTCVSNDGASGRYDDGGKHAFGWRDAMDIVVRWRQVGEPNDQVLWVDRLTPEEFSRGFGSHTPMFSGQTKCVRYYMNCTRGLRLFGDIIRDQGHVVNANDERVAMSPAQLAAIASATTPAAMYAAIGLDCWVVVPIRSLSRTGHTLEGTRLTLTASKEVPDGHEFSIRTPVTPPRWEDFDAELAVCFEAIVAAALADDRPRTARAILHFVYYWYNFMPLARGSAAVGYTTVLSLCWAFGMPVSAAIPINYQADWEAILCRDPDGFVAALSKWQLPPAALADPSKGHESAAMVATYKAAPLADLPDLLGTLGTLRKRFHALNHGTAAAAAAAAKPVSPGGRAGSGKRRA